MAGPPDSISENLQSIGPSTQADCPPGTRFLDLVNLPLPSFNRMETHRLLPQRKWKKETETEQKITCLDWVLSPDSTVCCCKDRGWFSRYMTFETKVLSETPTGEQTMVDVVGIGAVDIPVRRRHPKSSRRANQSNLETLHLEFVFHTPSVDCNIIAESKLTNAGRVRGRLSLAREPAQNMNSSGIVKIFGHNFKHMGYFRDVLTHPVLKLSDRTKGLDPTPTKLTTDFVLNRYSWNDAEERSRLLRHTEMLTKEFRDRFKGEKGRLKDSIYDLAEREVLLLDFYKNESCYLLIVQVESSTTTATMHSQEAPIPSDLSTAATPAGSVAASNEKKYEDSERDAEKTAGYANGANATGTSVEEADAAPTGTVAVRTLTGVKWYLVCAGLFITAFLYGLDTTIAADVQAPVVEAFGHAEQLVWVGSGFPMGSIAVLLFVGTLYSNFNGKWVYIGCIIFFEVGSVLCGAAPSMNALIIGRVLAGAGGSGLYLGSLTYFSVLCTPAERGFYIAFNGFFWGVGAVLGPIVGGAFAVSSATWRWAFYINLVLGAAGGPVYVFLMPSIHPISGKTIRERLATFDMIGFLLIAGTWVFFTVGFVQAGTSWTWNDGRTIAMLVLFAVFVLASIFQQYFTIFTTKATRAFPGHLLKSRTQVLLFIVEAASSTTMFMHIYYIPIYFQFVHQDSAIQAAIRLLPFVIILVTINVIEGHFIGSIKYYMPVYTFGGILILIAGALENHYLNAVTSKATIYGLTVLASIGTGLTIQLGYAVASLTVPPAEIGNALSMMNIAQVGATVICLVVAGQVYQSVAVENLTAALAGHGFTADEIAGSVTGAQSPLFAQLSGELRDAAINAIVGAMQRVFILIIVAGAVMIVASLGMKRERLAFS
ncbi:major facilitator superfamily domain-containing protein [Bombardia bombarda]|uniref:Major facilitator superfamily domain-containing protein n=1 Tax=Bombardia bombarda TaxID=252184 RepID=A0AA40C9W9_9PEZI|nr:major facilitator superfamily domain-containing protein [Bombardia bombarda]